MCLLILLLGLNALGEQGSDGYAQCFFLPLQKMRVPLFNWFPFSVGDILYLVFMLYLVRTIWKLIRNDKQESIMVRALRVVRGAVFLYVVVVALWGVNYKQSPFLSKLGIASKLERKLTLQEWMAYEELLIARLNTLHQFYKPYTFDKVNTVARNIYDKNWQISPVLKHSLLGATLGYWGIEGYFNPLTGEGQMNATLPDFSQPFVMCHEMAHQVGIANEAEANLLAYINCLRSNDPTFQYSGCLTLWMYVHRKVMRMDSLKGDSLKTTLAPLVITHLEVLKKRREYYKGILDNVSDVLFDAYLKIEQQPDGIASYRNVAVMAWIWEHHGQEDVDNLIYTP